MLYIIRHGTTKWNKEYRLQGRSDIPLAEEGIEEARLKQEEIKKLNIDICYCSPLIRAKQTASILLEGLNVPLIYDERLEEMSFGEYEGMDFTKAKISNVNKFFVSPENYVADKNAESIENLRKRIASFIKEFLSKEEVDKKNILIVGHGAMNSCLIMEYLGLSLKDYWKFGLKHCQIIKLEK